MGSMPIPELSDLEQAAREASAAAKYISSYCDLNSIPNPAFGPTGADPGPIRHAPEDLREARQRLLGAATKLQLFVTDPTEYLAWQSVQYQIITAVRWLCHFEVLTAIPLHSAVSYNRIASVCNVPVRQLQIMAGMAMASNFLCEPEPGQVAHNTVSRCFATNHAFPAWTRFMTDYYMPCAAHSIAATEKWGETGDKQQTASNLAMDTPLTSFDFITQNKELGRLFSGYMKGVHSGIATNVSQVVEDYN
jgi:6-hydroxytryprostatin B O-methyltransferase